MANEWFIRKGDKVYGPCTDAALDKLIEAGKVTAEDEMGPSSTGPWTPVAACRRAHLEALPITALTEPDDAASESPSDWSEPEAQSPEREARAWRRYGSFYWYLRALRRYAQFRGRASRPAYWWFVFYHVLFSLFFATVDAHIGVSPLLLGTYSLVLLCPTIAAAVRRLHDSGHSGWWFLIALVPYVGPVAIIILLAQRSAPIAGEGAAQGPAGVSGRDSETVSIGNVIVGVTVALILCVLAILAAPTFMDALEPGSSTEQPSTAAKAKPEAGSDAESALVEQMLAHQEAEEQRRQARERRERNANFFADEAHGQVVRQTYDGGKQLDWDLKDWEYNEYKNEYLLDLDLSWSGEITGRLYRASGKLRVAVDEDGRWGWTWEPYWHNANLVKWLERRKAIRNTAIGIGVLGGLLKAMSESAQSE